ncbi:MULTISPECIES: hypothetical protein [unclassified Actinomyces]|uniref:hypothetical protein n=1 Tax=unclassified Actinomyces TaxID=2609248 RepID=UPI0013A6F5A1|nr:MULTISPECIES: hypothetical protein [unclassified Actinomyces]MBW3068315.1 hypothetical protein [Actinomyces sp. 594]NDR53688.1 hypothetical protein [Actinomyces sp. 565]
MTSPTPFPGQSGPAPADQDRLSPRAIGTAILAGLLAFGVVLGGGLALGRGKDYATPAATDLVTYISPSPDWTAGAEQTWTTTVAANAQVITVPGHLLTLETGDNPADATLTAYALSDSGAAKSWSAQVDASTDAGDTGDDFDIPMKPAYLMWGKNTLIHDTTLYDLDTGETREAPWSSSDGVMIAEDIAMACASGGKCTAYREDQPDTPQWTATMEYPERYFQYVSNFYQTVFVRDGQRYCILGSRTIHNIDTGERVPLTIPVPEENIVGYGTYATTDGWMIYLTDFSNRNTVYAFPPEGGEPIDSYADSEAGANNQSSVSTYRARSQAELKDRFADGSTETLLGIVNRDDNNCAQSVEVIDKRTIEVTQFTDDLSCLSAIHISEDRTVMTAGLGAADAQDVLTFRLMYNADTGEEITFPGMDTSSGALFDLVAEDYAIGYDPATGTLIGYRPAS